MAFQMFPKWKYHPTEAPRHVENPIEEAALGEGWSDRIFVRDEPAPVEAPAEGVDLHAPAAPLTPNAGLPPQMAADLAVEQERVNQLANLKADDAIAAIAQMADEDALMRVFERETQGKARKGVLAAVQARVKALQADAVPA
jgi:hypothetical protein